MFANNLFHRARVSIVAFGSFATVAAVYSSGPQVHLTKEATTTDFKKTWERTVRNMQSDICAAVEKIDGQAKFREDVWQREHGGGGWTRVLSEGKVFEKAGVNVSTVFGELPAAAAQQMKSRGIDIQPDQKVPFFACGVSLVLHPLNPNCPTVHANWRYFELQIGPNKTVYWFGGGSDLTPSILFEDDCVTFHQAQKDACDKHDKAFHKRFKKWCDEYFYLPHRGESRGVGGIFYDDLDQIRDVEDDDEKKEALRQFAVSSSEALVKAYTTIMERRKNMAFTPEDKHWQQIRRGRYVEFNLAIDRGTKFGLQTPGSRTESILMSLPLTARWEYMHEPKLGSKEDQLLQVLKNPKDWV